LSVRREAANRVTIYCRAETVRRRGGTERGTLRAGRVRVCGAVGHPRVPWLRRLQLFQVRPGRCAHWRLEGPLLSRFGRFRSLGGGARGLTPMGCVRTHSLQRHTADGDGTVRYPGGAHQPGGGEDAHLVRSAPRHGRDPTAHELTRGPGGGWHTATNKVRNVTVGISGWGGRSRGCYATPADSPRHDGTPYRELHVRRECLGFVPGSKAIFCRAVPNLGVTICTFCVAGWRRTGSRVI
jgi:hypothetical protein